MGDFLEYSDVVQENRGAYHPGRLKLQSTSIIFKNIKTGRIDTFQSADVEKAAWLMRARGYCLKLTFNNGTIHRFDGLKETEFEKLQNFLSNNYSVKMEKQEMSYRGWNWGAVDFVANALDFKVNEKLAFEVPLNNVSHSMSGKNEVTLEFHQNDDANVSLMELRFHLPPSTNEETDRCEEFCKKVLDKADIIQVSGEAIAIFQEIQCLTPRGRYDVKIYPTFLQLHGKTFDYKIPFTTILRLFLLPHRDGRQMFFAVSLDPPIKQGQTRYPFLIMLFNKEDETTLELTLSEEELAEKYEGKIQKEMSGLEYEVVSRIMKTFVNRKITVPGSFLGNTGTQSVACSYKAATGFLYPLERGFIFVHKPPLHIRFDEIGFVNFARSAGNTRSFDFDIETKTGTTYTFVGIEKDEYGKLYDFVSEKKLRVKNIGGKTGGTNYAEDLDDSDDDGQHDAYMERMKREGKDKVVDDDDDDDSTDESYHLPDYGSEVAEEFDTDYSSDSDSDYQAGSNEEADEEAREKRREQKDKERREKREKKEKKEKKRSKPDGEKTQRKRKKNKDPNKPKRAATAYMLWLGEKRESFKEENPGISIIELTKLAGEKWRAMTAEDKEPFEKEAAKDKERYKEEMEEYKKNHQDDEPGSPSPKTKKTKTKTKSPKKATGETKQGSGGSYKSKEFISDSSDDSDDSDKPLKKKSKKEKPKKEEKEAKESGDEAGDEADSPAEESGKEDEKSGSEKEKSGSESEAEKGSDSD